MSVTINRNAGGKYGVVEPNHLSAPRNGQVYAQRPAAASINVLENGMFVNYGADEVTLGGKYMVFNEEKLYDPRKQSHADYAMKKEDFYDGKMVPRVFFMHTGDIFTTNTVKNGTYTKGNKLVVNASTGVLEVGTENAVAEVIAETTLPDGITPAIKVQML